MKDAGFRMITTFGFALAALAAVAFAAAGRISAALGVCVGAAWMFLNFFFLFRLVAMSVAPPTDKIGRRLAVLSVLKFPVLYVAGYFILASRYFPVESLVAGLTAFVAALAVLWGRLGAAARGQAA
jgi:hypothetical protein